MCKCGEAGAAIWWQSIIKCVTSCCDYWLRIHFSNNSSLIFVTKKEEREKTEKKEREEKKYRKT